MKISMYRYYWPILHVGVFWVINDFVSHGWYRFSGFHDRVKSRLYFNTSLGRIMTPTFRDERVAFALTVKELLVFYLFLSCQLTLILGTDGRKCYVE